MSDHPSEKPDQAGVDLGRRAFLQKGGAALASGVALTSLPALAGGGEGAAAREEGRAEERVTAQGWKKPNLLILITDQERYPQHWPEGWADANLPNRKRLSDRGLTFTSAFCASAMCTPSRATLFTGLFPPEHKVDQTLRYGTGETCVDQPTLQPASVQKNMATMLESAGYDVHYRGKWHISKDPSGTKEIGSQRDMDNYRFFGWRPPEAGADQNPSGFGGGTTNWDQCYTGQAVEFLQNAKADAKRPFALIVCLVNPHDIMSYPGVSVADGGMGGWDSDSFSDIPPHAGTSNYKNQVDFYSDPLNLIQPPDNGDPEPFKPAAQAQSTQFWGDPEVLGPLDDQDQQLEYVHFYAYLHMVSDGHFGTILDVLDSRPKLRDNTLVIRLSDHGEMGLSHGGMRQKAYNAYEETIHVPLVISNPKLFKGPVQTSALASLVDLMPTLATIADVPNRDTYTFRGTDLTPVILDAIRNPWTPTVEVQDSVLFTTDEILASLPLPKHSDPYVTAPSHIRCLREGRWKIVMYFDPSTTNPQPPYYELYDLQTDAPEAHNCADPDPSNPYYNPAKLSEMIAKLQAKMAQTHTTPT